MADLRNVDVDPVDHIFGRLGGHQLLDLGQLGRLLAEPPWPCLGLPRACGFEARRTIRYMADAFESILVAWLAFVFLPEKPTRSQGGTDGSNPLSSSGESAANRFPHLDSTNRLYSSRHSVN